MKRNKLTFTYQRNCTRSFEDFENYAQRVFSEIRKSGKEIDNCKIDDLGVVNERCRIVEKVDEGRSKTTLYCYDDVPKSPVVRTTAFLETVDNPEFARRLYCGKVWTSHALEFTDLYYREQK